MSVGYRGSVLSLRYRSCSSSMELNRRGAARRRQQRNSSRSETSAKVGMVCTKPRRHRVMQCWRHVTVRSRTIIKAPLICIQLAPQIKVAHCPMSALGHKQTKCIAAKSCSFDHFVGGCEQGLRERQAERLGRPHPRFKCRAKPRLRPRGMRALQGPRDFSSHESAAKRYDSVRPVAAPAPRAAGGTWS